MLDHHVLDLEGDVLMTVRPEDVHLEPQSDKNIIEAKVLTRVYMGTYTQVQLDVAGATWLAHGPADFQATVGETVPVELPISRIWLLPPTGNKNKS